MNTQTTHTTVRAATRAGIAKTIKDVIHSNKIRKGKAAGANGVGAYWILEEVIDSNYDDNRKLKNRAKVQFRHYRGGLLTATLVITEGSFQGGYANQYYDVDEILEANSAEAAQVLIAQKVAEVNQEREYELDISASAAGPFEDWEELKTPKAPDEE